MKASFKYIFICAGTLLLALGINLFLVPLKLSCGGISGVGTILLYYFKIPLSVSNLALNSVLFIFGLKVLGRMSVLRTVLGSLSLSLFLELSRFLPIPKVDTVGAVFLGGALVGLGVGVVVRAGGSSGGSDFLGLLLKRKIAHVSIATIILIIDSLVIIASGIVFKELSITIYSLICMFISSRVSDAIIDIGHRAKAVYITSLRGDEIKGVILRDFERGVTEIYTQGGFSMEKRLMLYCIVSPKEAPQLVKAVSKIDPSAFVVISDVREVLGEGFLKM